MSELSDKTPVDFLILAALDEELQVLKETFPSLAETASSTSALKYYFSDVQTESTDGHLKIAYTCLFSMGNPQAATMATHAIQELNPKILIMFGLAGGVKARVELGDVVIPTQIVFYEPAKVAQDGSENRPEYIPTDTFLTKRMQSFATDLRLPYKMAFGPLGIGEKVIASESVIEKLVAFAPKLAGVEMESYGVIIACANSIQRPRFIAIRGISDHADKNKGDSHRRQALQNAADFLKRFLISGDASILEGDKQSQSQKLIAIHHLSLDRRSSVLSSLAESLSDLKNQELIEVKIDQTDLFKDGHLVDPIEAIKRQNDIQPRIDNLLNDYPEAYIGYFGLAHIPLVFHLGYKINRRVVPAYPTNRQTGCWEALPQISKSWPKIHAAGMPKTSDLYAKEIILVVNVSYPISNELICQVVPMTLPMLTLGINRPATDSVLSEAQLDDYARAFQSILVNLNKLFPSIRHIHVFFAGPPTLAFRLGQQISRTVDPELIVYNFSRKDVPNYGWALNLSSGEVLDFRK
jgi:nucleoside phosphorylase